MEGFPGGSEGKASACSVGALGSIPGLGRSLGEGYGNHVCFFLVDILQFFFNAKLQRLSKLELKSSYQLSWFL